MKNKLIIIFITSCLVSGASLAKDDCFDPVSEWQSREQLRQMMVDKGWKVKRIKVDDGCYEVKGRDRKGHRVEAKFSPATLEIIELEIKFDGSGDSFDYLQPGKHNGSQKSGAYLDSESKASKNKPKVTVE